MFKKNFFYKNLKAPTIIYKIYGRNTLYLLYFSHSYTTNRRRKSQKKRLLYIVVVVVYTFLSISLYKGALAKLVYVTVFI